VYAAAKLVDLRSGQKLWQGHANVAIGQNNNGLVGALVGAIINQIANNLSDRAHDVARTASYQLLSVGRGNSILYGSYHPKRGTD
jgi:hypothetical protein